MSNAPSKPVSFSRPKVGYFSNRPRIHAPGGIQTHDLSRQAAAEESYRLWCVVVCDLETSRIGAPYIYDISCLRVNTSAHCSGRKQVKGKLAYKQLGYLMLVYKGMVGLMSSISKPRTPNITVSN